MPTLSVMSIFCAVCAELLYDSKQWQSERGSATTRHWKLLKLVVDIFNTTCIISSNLHNHESMNYMSTTDNFQQSFHDRRQLYVIQKTVRYMHNWIVKWSMNFKTECRKWLPRHNIYSRDASKSFQQEWKVYLLADPHELYSCTCNMLIPHIFHNILS